MAEQFKAQDLYISPQGNDRWSGRLAAPNAEGTDGPLATLECARDVVRERVRTGGFAGSTTVWLRGGRYPMTEPVVFTPQDSAPVTYAAYPGEEPILDGGALISGWRQERLGDRVAWVADVPPVVGRRLGYQRLDPQPWRFRQLWVNGERRARPRLPKKDYYWMADVPAIDLNAQLFEGSDTFRCEPGDIRPWHNLEEVEVVALHYWVEERMPIASFDEATNTVRSSRRSIFALKDDWRESYAKYYVENVFEALTEPGEWYLDTTQARVYYLPLPGETLEGMEAYAPVAEQLIRLEGAPDEGRYVEHIRFQGLTLEHTESRQPSGGGEAFGMPGIEFAAAPQAAMNIPGVIQMEGARACAVEDCVIRRIGWYGVEIGDGCNGVRVVGNTISDMGAGGVKLSGVDVEGPIARRSGNCRITDNWIHHGGHVFHSAVGVLARHSYGNDISHNHIHDLYYTGISCGWVWGFAASVSCNNRIEKNHIHHLGKRLLSDMGGIYTLGVQPGTVLRGNLIHDIEKWNYGGWAIYPDEGSSHLLIEHNIGYNTSSQPFHQHYGRENIVRNNIWAYGGEGQARTSRVGPDKQFTFQRNILVSNGTPVFIGGYPGILDQRNFYSDVNLLWDASGEVQVAANVRTDAEARQLLDRVFSLEEWQAMGFDRHSMVADPCFADLEARDFTLAEDSPAWALGFEPIDLSDVGPRPKDRRE